MRLFLTSIVLMSLFLAPVYAGFVSETLTESSSSENIGVYPFIVDLKVTGNVHVPVSEISSVLATKKGGFINKIKLLRDRRAIEKLGFFEDVQSRVYENQEGQVVEFIVRENPFVLDVSFDGNTVFDSEKLKELLTMKKGTILNRKELQQDKSSIEAFYHNAGYTFAKVVKIKDQKIASGSVVSLVIREGVVEKIIVEGNTTTKEKVITRELKMSPGDVFNQNELMNDGRRVFALNFFKDVRPRFFPGSEKGKYVIAWNVEEKRTNSFNFGGSFGSSYGFSVFADLHLSNYDGWGRLISLKGQWGASVSSYQLKYQDPWFMEPKTSMTSRLWNTDSEIDYSSEGESYRTGGDFALSRKLDDNWSVSGKTKYESVRPKDDDEDDYRIFGLTGSVSYDTRDIWMNPTKGYFSKVSVENNNGLLGGTVYTTRYFLSNDFFFPVMDKNVLATHLSWAEAFGEIEDAERFSLGGGNTVRGYADGEPIARGSRRLVSNVEYRLTLNDIFQGVAFYDFGFMGAVDKGDVFFEGDNSLRSGWGLGFRINSPMGPIRIDFGWTDPKGYLIDEGEDTEKRRYSAVHFNIGHAF